MRIGVRDALLIANIGLLGHAVISYFVKDGEVEYVRVDKVEVSKGDYVTFEVKVKNKYFYWIPTGPYLTIDLVSKDKSYRVGSFRLPALTPFSSIKIYYKFPMSIEPGEYYILVTLWKDMTYGEPIGNIGYVVVYSNARFMNKIKEYRTPFKIKVI